MTDKSRQPNGGDTFVCPWWLIYLFDNPLRGLFQPAARILEPLVAPGSSCLDVGCGMGYFTVPMAKIVGPTGSVTAVDLQTKMLEGAARRARRNGVADRIVFCRPEDSEWRTPRKYDFVLVFWMLHEVPDQRSFLETLRGVLKPSGRVLLVEPRVHLPKRKWEDSLALAKSAGFDVTAGPSVAFSRTATLQ